MASYARHARIAYNPRPKPKAEKTMRSLSQIAARLDAGEPSRALIDQCIERIKDPAGEGDRVFLKVYGEAARTAADAFDQLRRRDATPSPYAGVPIAVKDLFDVAGDVTTAGSVALRQAPAATRDAPTIARMRAAGFVPIGRTNMTEFAFSGLGINPHYGTPRNPYDRKTGRIPGGSSSGLAVPQTLVLDGMDKEVAAAFSAALTRLSGAGARIVEIPLRELAELPQVNAKGGFAAA